MLTPWSGIGWGFGLDLGSERVGNSPRGLGDGRGGRLQYLLSQSEPFARRAGGLVLRVGLGGRRRRW